MSEVVIMDTETTGIGPGHRILEIGGVIWDYESDKISGEFETLINPERDIDAKARLRLCPQWRKENLLHCRLWR